MSKCKTIPLVLSSIFVALFAVGHLIRFIWSVPLVIGTFHVPLWISGVLFLVFGLLAAWSFKALCPCCHSSCSIDKSCCSTDKSTNDRIDRQM
jgi:hypothetical protein